MSNKTIIAIAVAIIIILAAAMFWWKPFSAPTPAPGPDGALPSPNPSDGVVADDSNRIVANHYFASGRHTVEGNITLPTPCHKLSYDAKVAESAPEQVTIAFAITASDEICVQVLSNKFFSVSFSASENAEISATINGIPIALLLNEGGEGNLK